MVGRKVVRWLGSEHGRAWREPRPVAGKGPPTVRMADRRTGQPGAQSLTHTAAFLSRRVCTGNGEAPGGGGGAAEASVPFPLRGRVGRGTSLSL